jgi:hypothetical protein
MANCHVCGRGFPSAAAKDAHLAEHPGYKQLRPVAGPPVSVATIKAVKSKRGLSPLPTALLAAST